jgi:hypothetical protein
MKRSVRAQSIECTVSAQTQAHVEPFQPRENTSEYHAFRTLRLPLFVVRENTIFDQNWNYPVID